ncbi:MAG: NUDIX hydrolase [Candidatus Micrarchaeota archaeon]|nr:NUDIX hydrolase [Candidatus Micrarchaeota archaeon]
MTRPFACDGVIIQDNKIVLIKRGFEPFKGQWAVPGGRIEDNETAEQCLIREMKEETNLDVVPLKLIGVYSDPKRDPRGIIVASYLCKVVGGELKAGDDAGDAKWVSLDNLPKLASDHAKIVHDALILLKLIN